VVLFNKILSIKTKMRFNKVLIIVAISAIALTGCVSSPAAPSTTQQATGGKLYPYSFNSAKIDYTLTGNISGTSTRYFKGDNMALESHTTNTAKGGDEKSNTKTIYSGHTMYQIDLDNKTAMAANNPDEQDLANIPASQKVATLVSKMVGPAGNNKPTGQKTVAGQNCDLYDLSGLGEICLWNGIPLYSKLAAGEFSSETTATNIAINAQIDDNVFQVPADIKITDPRITK
jgi:hypothetical protein